MKELSFLGHSISIYSLGKNELRGINVEEYITYNFYVGEYRGIKLLFLEPKKRNPSPKTCAITADRISKIKGLPVVFILESAPSYERQRLMDKDVFFIMGNKFANLPMLVANERMRTSKPTKKLTPVAQYILLYHLQVESLEGLSAKDMINKIPYSYESITLGITCLCDMELCEKVASGQKNKIIHFLDKGKNLWDKAKDCLIDPVDKNIFCDALNSEINFPKCNINALAHYTWLNPDETAMIMMNKKELQNLISENALLGMNEFDGNVMIEIWKYPIVSLINEKNEWVDKLSLALSLKSDKDPRVEGEVERLINEIQWKD